MLGLRVAQGAVHPLPPCTRMYGKIHPMHCKRLFVAGGLVAAKRLDLLARGSLRSSDSYPPLYCRPPHVCACHLCVPMPLMCKHNIDGFGRRQQWAWVLRYGLSVRDGATCHLLFLGPLHQRGKLPSENNTHQPHPRPKRVRHDTHTRTIGHTFFPLVRR